MIELIQKVYLKILMYIDPIKAARKKGVKIKGGHGYQGLSLLAPNVTVGENAIVGARSVVTKDVPDNAVVAGVPAKVICTVEELAEKYLANTPKYDDWHSMQEKMKTTEMIAVYVRENKQNN